METEEKDCMECGVRIRGRSDKKFCSDLCRNAFNNRQNSDVNSFMKTVNNTLRKNRRIMMTLNPTKKTKVTRNQLLKLGFNFKYFTHTYTTKAGTIYYFCYEQGYLPLENDYLALVVNKDNY
jgi:predicted nucleic acid-binding Zn ribbon protein